MTTHIVADISFGLAIAGAATTVVLLVKRPEKKADAPKETVGFSPWATPQTAGATVWGTFQKSGITAEVLRVRHDLPSLSIWGFGSPSAPYAPNPM